MARQSRISQGKRKLKKAAKTKRKQPYEYDHFEVFGVSVYKPDADKVNEILERSREVARSRGLKPPSRSEIVRNLIKRGLDSLDAEGLDHLI